MHCSTSLLTAHHPIPPPSTTARRRLSPRMSLNPQPQPPDVQSSLLSSITKLLWGPSLPPGLLIFTVRTAWHSTWRLMMSQLAPSDPSGAYSRPASRFRAHKLPQSIPTPPHHHLHLYVGLPCPWAHRTLVVRALKGLDDAVAVSVAAPGTDGSWEFRDRDIPGPDKGVLVPGPDNANKRRTLKEVYGLRKGGYNGRSTVPMLWDTKTKDVVCNESYDIIQLFNSELNGLARNPDLDLSPPGLKDEIEKWNGIIYPNVNNGVYRCGFAQSQEAYDKAVNQLFDTLDMLDVHLGSSSYLCGDKLTLADVCLFTTLVRFDLVYNGLFKCTKKKMLEYPNLHAYLRHIYQIPKVAETCNFLAIMDGYYKTLFPLNPGSISPVMPSGCGHEALSRPHNRDSLSLTDKTAEMIVS
ncbi:hypothetical protein TIFTF001_038975 [Ficus carica]|uniref:GST C-terminal domain-containing protein n=1 Tax=Ficus carica TaxID=3494 RepID=A0AA88E8X2_FICCA|nr:hypothetical protein TIFTF001_038911 [Ficus carica]GMN69874.1 hypothetical protein TIFTF001_038919 [Ficus carica]GMN69923.1 hypothetical protein TIFTF001_038967 [Ficus carica]GMN69930.1 hypothetical protein TIFTF001_038975 [Ficus carica]